MKYNLNNIVNMLKANVYSKIKPELHLDCAQFTSSPHYCHQWQYILASLVLSPSFQHSLAILG